MQFSQIHHSWKPDITNLSPSSPTLVTIFGWHYFKMLPTFNSLLQSHYFFLVLTFTSPLQLLAFLSYLLLICSLPRMTASHSFVQMYFGHPMIIDRFNTINCAIQRISQFTSSYIWSPDSFVTPQPCQIIFALHYLGVYEYSLCWGIGFLLQCSLFFLPPTFYSLFLCEKSPLQYHLI